MRRWLFALLLAAVTLFTALPALAAPNVSMSAQMVGGGRYRPDSWGTVLVDLANQGGELEAELVVESAGPTGERIEYVVPLTIAAGSSKRVPVEVALQRGNSLRVLLKGEGTVIQRADVPLYQLAFGAPLIGVLSEDELGVPGLSLLGSGDAATAAGVARLDATILPGQAALLSGFDVIALSRFDASALTKEQVQALEVWVGRGGTLVLAGGPEWKRTFAPLPPSLVPVEVTGVTEIDLSPLATLVGKAITGKAPVSTGKVLRGQVLLAAGDVPLLVQDQVGSGRVFYQAFDPGLDPVVRWQGQKDLYERLLRINARPDQFVDYGGGPIQSALQRIPGLALPSPAIIGSILLLYLLLVGPVSYWILKRRDKREWAWVTVPALSLTFVGAVYGVGFNKQVSVVTHVITVAELYPGAKGGTMTAYAGLYAPSRNVLSVPLDKAALIRPLHLGGMGGEENRVSTRVVAGERTRVDLLNMNKYSMRGFAMEQDIATPGGIAITDITVGQDGLLRGRVVNRLDQAIDDAQVLVANQAFRIGRLEPGASSEVFELDISRARSFRGGPGFEVMFTSGFGQNLEPERRRMVLSQVFGWEGQNLPAGSIVVAGWTERPLADVPMPELGRVTQETNMVYASLPIPIESLKGDIPPGIILGVRTGGGNFGKSPFGYNLHQGSHTFRFVLPALDPARVADLTLHMNVMGQDGGYSMRVKNQNSGQWVDLGAATIATLPNWQELVGPGGTVELQMDVDRYIDMSPPTIAVKGVGR